MKKDYEMPCLEMERFLFEDILTASGFADNIAGDQAPDEIEDPWGLQ